MIELMPQVSSIEERVQAIERKRPQLGRIHSIIGIPWTKSVRALQDLGIISHLISRLADAGIPADVATSRLNTAFKQLRRLEQQGMARLIRGEGYATLWPSER
jgi:hypothetical protein